MKFMSILGIAALLFFLGVSIAARPIGAVSTAAGAVVVDANSTGWIDDQGRYVISGEAENNGTAPVENVTVTATLYNSSGETIATIFNYTCNNVLLPGRKSGFDLTLADTGKSTTVDHYALNVSSFTIAASRPTLLQLDLSSSYIDETNMTHVFGTIANNGSETATSVNVVVTCYNDSGYVMDVLSDQTTPNTIDPGQTAGFDIELGHASRAVLTTNWTITVESQEYEMIPEYNLPAVIGIILAVAAALAWPYARKAFFRLRNLHWARLRNRI